MHTPITPPSIQIPPTLEGLVKLCAKRNLLNKHLSIKQLLLVTQTTLARNTLYFGNFQNPAPNLKPTRRKCF